MICLSSMPPKFCPQCGLCFRNDTTAIQRFYGGHPSSCPTCDAKSQRATVDMIAKAGQIATQYDESDNQPADSVELSPISP